MSDSISRENALDIINKLPKRGAEGGGVYVRINDVFDAIESLPSEDRPNGEWIINDIQCVEDTENGNYQYTCSNCGHGDLHARTQAVPYCWFCGADMRSGDME